jgi:DNA-binding NarL/FixJ family response regulator
VSDDRIRIVLVEDHSVFRQAMTLALNMEPDSSVVDGAGTVVESCRPVRSRSRAPAVAAPRAELAKDPFHALAP